MGTAAETAKSQADETSCWCCGATKPDDALVHLSSHPEVGICVNCVHYLRRRARDYQATVARQRLRDAADSVRDQVIARGLHQRPVIGPALRWLNRHLPW